MTALIPNTRLSHGTIECEHCLTSRSFYQDVLGLGSVRPLAEAQYLWSGGPWSLVCVAIGEQPKAQGVENRFCLRVETAAEVDAARESALAAQSEHGIREIGAVTERDGVRSFVLHDRDGNWWEISNVSGAYYDEVFLRGDVAV
jgi:catechol 2,3-dioxygenase-like lactoylglutathione lyase family enzyme